MVFSRFNVATVQSTKCVTNKFLSNVCKSVSKSVSWIDHKFIIFSPYTTYSTYIWTPGVNCIDLTFPIQEMFHFTSSLFKVCLQSSSNVFVTCWSSRLYHNNICISLSRWQSIWAQLLTIQPQPHFYNDLTALDEKFQHGWITIRTTTKKYRLNS